MTDHRFAVLAVCHANLCRSPMVEGLTRHALIDAFGSDLPIDVSSAGTDARPGLPMHPYAAAVLDAIGGDTAGFRTRILNPRTVAGADLVLTATREQRTRCVELVPSAVSRVFTLRQFGRIAAAVDPATLAAAVDPAQWVAALVREANLVRGELQPVTVDEDDLDDPVGQPLAAFHECARRIRAELLDIMLGLLATR
jgi:protein-tyrosine phosphatase